jgi:SAM-dependent methyltransferase
MRKKPNKDLFESRSERIDVAPYTVLAKYYDQVMDHVNYRAWASFVDKVATRQFNMQRGRALDFACGTGKFLNHLVRLGWDTVGVDGSAEMVDKARSIRAPSNRSMEWAVADFRVTPNVEPCDLGICVYDSLNYLLEPDEVGEFFRSARKVIRKGGLLVFDLSTEINSRMHFNGSVLDEQVKGGAYRRITRYDEDEHIQHNVFNIYPSNEDVVYVEHHQQRIYSIQAAIDLAEANGFEMRAVFHELTFRQGDETSDRVHIAAERL